MLYVHIVFFRDGNNCEIYVFKNENRQEAIQKFLSFAEDQENLKSVELYNKTQGYGDIQFHNTDMRVELMLDKEVK